MHTHEQALVVHYKGCRFQTFKRDTFSCPNITKLGSFMCSVCLKGKENLRTASRSSWDILKESMETLYARKTANGS